MNVTFENKAVPRTKQGTYDLEAIKAKLLEESERLKQRPQRSFILPLEDMEVTVLGSLHGEEIIVSTIMDGLMPEQEDYE